ncbi:MULTISPECIES: hypothetical protein [unclassified Candidatus Paralachnospira]|uniref:hypothetical protein n=1 Tax=unclassified Candidatus Paralachnospira TaxID=3099471 RepID=UPI003F8ED9F2
MGNREKEELPFRIIDRISAPPSPVLHKRHILELPLWSRGRRRGFFLCENKMLFGMGEAEMEKTA